VDRESWSSQFVADASELLALDVVREAMVGRTAPP
jgi:hypothetical protein